MTARDRPRGGRDRRTLCAVVALGLVGCAERGDAPAPAPSVDALAVLRAYEADRRRATDFARLPPWVDVSGPDPIALRAIPAAARAGSDACFVGALRGADSIVVLDCSMREIDRASAPTGTRGLAVGEAGDVWASGEASASIARWRLTKSGRLEAQGIIEVPGARSLRDLDAGADGSLHAIDAELDVLVTIPRAGRPRATQLGGGRAPLSVRRIGDRVLVTSLFDHALLAFPVDAQGFPGADPDIVVRRDGPIFGFDAVATGGSTLVAIGAVEDRPLDRTGGSFGNIDSFVSLVRLDRHEAFRVAEVNVSELGVVTPKALALDLEPGGLVRVTVTGYGSDRAAILEWPRLEAAAPAVRTSRAMPGITTLARSPAGGLAAGSTLLDAWSPSIEASQPGGVSSSPARSRASNGAGVAPVPIAGDIPRDPLVRVGEALAFTTLMAPWNRSDGPLSRFTCETCHLEGGVDGRTHHTGRGDVRATTKPLFGLFSNAPHFSRALDPDLTTISHAEFRVAGALSDHDEWFSLDEVDAPWLHDLGPLPDDVSPVGLRRALMAFLMAFQHAPNRAAADRDRMTDEERRGMGAFRDRCEGCHTARLSASDPATAVPFSGWERLVLSPEGPIVWGRAGYEKTGVRPYVHAEGARVPALRRLARKRPYFTNGSARTVADVLDAVRYGGSSFSHQGGGPDDTKLDPDERAALLAFLDLL